MVVRTQTSQIGVIYSAPCTVDDQYIAHQYRFFPVYPALIFVAQPLSMPRRVPPKTPILDMSGLSPFTLQTSQSLTIIAAVGGISEYLADRPQSAESRQL